MLLYLSEFPRRVRCCPRGFALNLSCLGQVSYLAPKRRTIADAIFLGGPPSTIRLCERDRIDRGGRRYDGNQLRSGGGNRQRRGLPIVFPPRLFQEIQISIPQTRSSFPRLGGNQTTQITRRVPPATEGMLQVDREAVRQSRPLLPRG